jgi:tetratricopeptide (TPR) repeat protein
LFTGGCWLFSSSVPDIEPIEIASQNGLSDDDVKLFEYANKRNRADGSVKELSEAVAAYEKLQDLIRGNQSDMSEADVVWRMAQAVFYASEQTDDLTEKLKWIVKGEEIADTLRAKWPARVEGYYFGALFKGRRAQNSGMGFGALKLAKEVRNLGEQAAQIDPSVDLGGPYRLLAMLFANAPPWPTSFGNVDKAIDYAEKAVDLFSDYPLNHLVMAEVLIEDDEIEEAKEELKKVISAPKTGKWAMTGELWRPYAIKLLEKLNED